MKLKYLCELASIVVGIDEDKHISDKNLVILTDRALHVIEQMKQSGLDVGSLRELFAGIQLVCDNKIVLPELIDMTHEEIARLLGRSAWRVYGRDELADAEVEACVKVAA